MPMYDRIKIARQVSKPMITPGTFDADVLPGSNSSASSGLTFDYRSIQVGDNSQVSYVNDETEEEYIESNEVDDDNTKGNGAFVGSKEEGFELHRSLGSASFKLAFPDYQQYQNNPQMYDMISEGPDAVTTQQFNTFNTYYVNDDQYELKSLLNLQKLLPVLAKAAQKVYDNWTQDEEDDLSGGGICDLIADAMCDEMSKIGIECATISYSIGEVHVACIAKLKEGIFTIDIDPSYYETGGGYTWHKINNIIFDPTFITIARESSEPSDFSKYVEDYSDDGKFVSTEYNNKLTAIAYPNLPQYSDIKLYEESGSNPHNTVEDEFDIFETNFIDDTIETEDDDLIKPSISKKAFIKTAVTYDSNSVIQELIKIPQVKALIDQEASGFVDQIIVTSIGKDVQDTQQQLLNKPQSPGIAPITLQPISGNPLGHMFMSEDTTTHQKKPLDKIVRIDRVIDQWGTLNIILHEISHHRHPTWSESQVEAESERLASTVKQYISTDKTASLKTDIMFVNQNFNNMPIIKCDVASTYSDQVMGLQSYSSLKPHNGLLFTYPTQRSATFHMGTVKFPIDIIFVNAKNKIVNIYRNCQPNSTDLYQCDDASKVIEVVASLCNFHNINIGDHVFYADDREEGFTRHLFEKLRSIKLEQQKELGMTDWNIKIVMKKEPDSRRFIKVSWSDEDYVIKKAELLINPDPILIKEALKEMPIVKVIRHALLHILAGHKEELDEDREYKMIGKYL